MKVITAVYDGYNIGYRNMAQNLVRSTERFDYVCEVLPIEQDPMLYFEHSGKYFTHCYFKPYTIKAALLDSTEDILWCDSDCLVQARVDDMLDECDVALTLRRFTPDTLRSIYDGYINAGVMAFRNNEKVQEFIDWWTRFMGNSGDSQDSDQMALNRLLIEHSLMERYREIININGVRIQLLDCDTYNFFYFDESPELLEQAKILHVKGHLRETHYQSCLQKVFNDATLTGSV